MVVEKIDRKSPRDLVRRWQNFLLGQSFAPGIADGVFGQKTVDASADFQLTVGLTADGVVGPKTIAAAEARGFHSDEESIVIVPSELVPLKNNSERAKAWGAFRYEAEPVLGNPEAIKILDGWVEKNIVYIEIPQLQKFAPNRKPLFPFHRWVAEGVKEMFTKWEAAGLIHHIKTWDGSWVPRFIRGSKSVLSNHAFGSAFDINARWNPLGAKPAPEGAEGSVVSLIKIAEECGWFWGANFKTRVDSMHLEATLSAKRK